MMTGCHYVGLALGWEMGGVLRAFLGLSVGVLGLDLCVFVCVCVRYTETFPTRCLVCCRACSAMYMWVFR